MRHRQGCRIVLGHRPEPLLGSDVPQEDPTSRKSPGPPVATRCCGPGLAPLRGPTAALGLLLLGTPLGRTAAILGRFRTGSPISRLTGAMATGSPCATSSSTAACGRGSSRTHSRRSAAGSCSSPSCPLQTLCRADRGDRLRRGPRRPGHLLRQAGLRQGGSDEAPRRTQAAGGDLCNGCARRRRDGLSRRAVRDLEGSLTRSPAPPPPEAPRLAAAAARGSRGTDRPGMAFTEGFEQARRALIAVPPTR